MNFNFEDDIPLYQKVDEEISEGIFIGSIVLLFLFYFMNRSHEVQRKGA